MQSKMFCRLFVLLTEFRGLLVLSALRTRDSVSLTSCNLDRSMNFVYSRHAMGFNSVSWGLHSVDWDLWARILSASCTQNYVLFGQLLTVPGLTTVGVVSTFRDSQQFVCFV